MSKFFVIVALIVIVVNAEPTVEPEAEPGLDNLRIVGGQKSVIENFPYQVSLQNLGQAICGGAIISAHYVLTAGHCVEGTRASELSVRAGTSLRTRSGSLHKVEQVILHPNYRSNRNGVAVADIAVLRVSPDFEFGPSCQPVQLFQASEASLPGATALVTGYGSTGEAGPRDGQLRSVALPILARPLCNRAYRQLGGLTRGQICAGYYGKGGKDSCQGDSGGPLTINGRLAGIVSWGVGCAEPEYPGVYTAVAHFRPWIRENTGV